ncbi:curli-like amyloid fiber formation chaperone CsgH [Pelagibacterium halotolerans]|uniref:curli-like amyloid fiber formation chaperone CsgH n=1 Tax=Pelagibacterium halotolerans TaxID=531813 RepID=UPI0038501196
MFGKDKSFGMQALAAGAALTALVALGGAGYANSSASNAAGSAHCDIAATQSGSMIALEGLLHAEKDFQGTYRFTVQSVGGANSSTISQGGGFVVEAEDTAVLGRVNLGGSGAVYDARLVIEIEGEVFECSSRIGAK